VIASELNIFVGFHHTLLTIVNVVLSQREKVSRREKMYSLQFKNRSISVKICSIARQETF